MVAKFGVDRAEYEPRKGSKIEKTVDRVTVKRRVRVFGQTLFVL